MEQLEDRSLLSGFASFQGDLLAPKDKDVLPIHITAADFSLHRWGVQLGFEMYAGDGSQLDPGRIQVKPQGRYGAAVWRSSNGAQQPSVTLATLRPGNFQLIVSGDQRTTGDYQVDVFLVGDANGDSRVDKSDEQAIHALRGKRLGQPGYVSEADANRNGVINAADEGLARANRGAATRIRPLELTLEFADINQVIGQVTLRGQTAPGARVDFDQGADGSIDQRATADGGGIYGFVTTAGAGLTKLRVKASDTFGQHADVTEEIFRLDVQLDSAAAASQPVGPTGGTLTTTGANGTTYSLVIPPGALFSEQVVTMTPIAAIPNLPLSEGLIAAAQFGPDGLEFFKPATLTIHLPDEVDASQIVGFGYQGAGGNLFLQEVDVSGSTITLALNHFSGGGAGQGTPNVPSLVNSLRQQYRSDPRSKLRSALLSADKTLYRNALTSYLGWKQRVAATEAALGSRGPAFRALLTPELQEGDGFAVQALHGVIEIENQQCENAPNIFIALSHVDAILSRPRNGWWLLANRLGLDSAANGLDYETLRQGVCVKVTSGDLDFVRSEPRAILTVQAGVFFSQNDTVFESGIQISVESSSGIRETSVPSELTNSLGKADFIVTPISDNTPVQFDLLASYFTPGGVELQNRFTVIGHAVRITPSSASVAPGGSQQFTANEAVTWSATGGTISNTGLYAAGSTAGNYTVTATSVADPSKSAQASIQIQSSSSLTAFEGFYVGSWTCQLGCGIYTGGTLPARLRISLESNKTVGRLDASLADNSGVFFPDPPAFFGTTDVSATSFKAIVVDGFGGTDKYYQMDLNGNTLTGTLHARALDSSVPPQYVDTVFESFTFERQ